MVYCPPGQNTKNDLREIKQTSRLHYVHVISPSMVEEYVPFTII